MSQDCALLNPACLLEEGDYMRFTKRMVPLVYIDKERHILPELVGTGKYKLHWDLYDIAHKLFGCAEISISIIK